MVLLVLVLVDLVRVRVPVLVGRHARRREGLAKSGRCSSCRLDSVAAYGAGCPAIVVVVDVDVPDNLNSPRLERRVGGPKRSASLRLGSTHAPVVGA